MPFWEVVASVGRFSTNKGATVTNHPAGSRSIGVALDTRLWRQCSLEVKHETPGFRELKPGLDLGCKPASRRAVGGSCRVRSPDSNELRSENKKGESLGDTR